MSFNLTAVQLPELSASSTIDTIEVDLQKTSGFWALTAKKFVLGVVDNKQYPNLDFCLSTTSNELLLMYDAVDICNDFREKLCNTRDRRNCKEETAKGKLSTLGNIVINFNNHEIVYKPEEYTYFDKGVFECRFDVPESERAGQKCPPNTHLGLGKLFFTILALASGQSLDGMPPFTTGTNLLDTVKQMLAKVNCSPTFRQMIEVVLLQNDYQKWPSFADIRD